MKSLLKFVTAISVLAIASPAFAAVDTPVMGDFTGKVLVNAGQGFFPADAKAVLKTGTKIMVGENSSAIVKFKSCSVQISKATVYSIPAKVPCDKGQTVAVVGKSVLLPASDVPPVLGGAAGGLGGAAGGLLGGVGPLGALATAGLLGGLVYLVISKP